MNDSSSPAASSQVARPPFGLQLKVTVLAAAVAVVCFGACLVFKRLQRDAAAVHAAKVAEGLRQNELMANGKDCTWDGRRP